MKRILLISAAVVSVFSLLAAGVFLSSERQVVQAATDAVAKVESQKSASQTEYDPADERFIVHEWGTFTSFSGSDGVRLEFRPLVDQDLPPFVLNRAWQAGDRMLFSKGIWSTLQRMETPVTYFYTNRERQVKARVAFPQGLLTEFYPPVAAMTPAFDPKAAEPVSNSSLDWGDLWIVPTEKLRPSVSDSELAAQLGQEVVGHLLQGMWDENHYTAARATDSALVYSVRPPNSEKPTIPHGSFFEKFLFYRGIGNFDLPLNVESAGAGRFELENKGEDPIRSLFLVSVEGDVVRFQRHSEIAPHERLILEQTTAAGSIDELCEAVTKSLVAEGLYTKEAKAMVATWRNSWFGEQGTRLFYLLPARQTDELLPLTIEPTPDETVRVMVGRLEIMSREEEQRMLSLVQSRATARAEWIAAHPEEAPTLAVPEELTRLGRLAEPALVRIRHLATDPAVKQEAEVLLVEFRPAT